jgi:GST-like protein
MKDRQPITLYGVMSPNVVKVAIMLEELGLPYELRHVAVFNGEQFTPEFQKLNIMGKVPVIVDPDLEIPMAESGAILFWLAERHHQFLPEAAPERYEVMQWLMVQMSTIGPMLGQYTHFRLLPEGGEPYATGRYGALAEKLYRKLDERLTGREWLAGDAYSIADIATFPWGEYLDRHGFDLNAFPALKRWRETIDARPAVGRAKARVFGEFAAPSAETIQSASGKDLDRFFGRSEKMPDKDYTSVKRMK